MTRQAHYASNPDHSHEQPDLWLAQFPPRSPQPTPNALVVARCVLVAVLLAVVFGLPHLLRSVGTAL